MDLDNEMFASLKRSSFPNKSCFCLDSLGCVLGILALFESVVSMETGGV